MLTCWVPAISFVAEMRNLGHFWLEYSLAAGCPVFVIGVLRFVKGEGLRSESEQRCGERLTIVFVPPCVSKMQEYSLMQGSEATQAGTFACCSTDTCEADHIASSLVAYQQGCRLAAGSKFLQDSNLR